MKSHTDFMHNLGYKVLEELGFGEFCVAYKVEDSNGIATLKLPRPTNDLRTRSDHHLTSYSERLSHIDTERRALLNSEGIIGVAQLEDTHEWVGPWHSRLKNSFTKGWPLLDKIVALRKNYIPGKRATYQTNLDSAGKYFLQRTVEELHNRGIALTDLKKSNLILEENSGLPYIIDVGYAKMKGQPGFAKSKEFDKLALEYIVSGKIMGRESEITHFPYF